MSALTTMLVVVAAMTAAPSPPAVTDGLLPELPGVELPELPALPELPKLPVVPPAATPAPTATPEPAATPGAPTAQTPAATPAATAAPAAPKTSQRRTPARRRPATTPRSATKAAARRVVARRSEPARPRRPEPRAAVAEPPRPVPGIAGDVIKLVEALPDAVLWALLGISGLALGLAGNAFWQSRQRVKLEAQRAELLGDIGLLSSALLPAVPERLDGLAVSAAYRPADGPAAGGDFYDVFPLDGDRLGVLLGDVSGHGRDSLTQAALARYTLRTLLAAGHAPGEALARADQHAAARAAAPLRHGRRRDLRPEHLGADLREGRPRAADRARRRVPPVDAEHAGLPARPRPRRELARVPRCASTPA